MRHLRAAASEWRGAKRRAAWLTWSSIVYERQALRRAAGGLRTPGMRAAFSTWVEMHEESRTRLTALRRAFMALSSRSLRLAMNTWSVAAAEAASARRRLAVAAREWGGGRVRGCWLAWCELADERRLMLRAAGAVLTPALRGALMTWREAASQSLHASRCLRGALLSLGSRGARLALNTWASFATARYAAHRRLAAAVREMRGGKVRGSMLVWCELVEHRRLMRSAASAMLAPALRCALRRWAGGRLHRRGQQRAARFLEVVASRLLRGHGLALGWGLWKRRHARRQRQRGGRLVERVAWTINRRGALRSALVAWARLPAEAARRAALVAERDARAALEGVDRERARWQLAYESERARAEAHERHAQQQLSSAAQRIRALEAKLRQWEHEYGGAVLEASSLRAQLHEEQKRAKETKEAARKLTQGLEGRLVHEEQRYEQLWRATHDAHYVGPPPTAARWCRRARGVSTSSNQAASSTGCSISCRPSARPTAAAPPPHPSACRARRARRSASSPRPRRPSRAGHPPPSTWPPSAPGAPHRAERRRAGARAQTRRRASGDARCASGDRRCTCACMAALCANCEERRFCLPLTARTTARTGGLVYGGAERYELWVGARKPTSFVQRASLSTSPPRAM